MSHCREFRASSMMRPTHPVARVPPPRSGPAAPDGAQVWSSVGDHDEELHAPGLVVSVFSAAARGGRGGDIFQVRVRGDGRFTRLVLADVAGHGESVARMGRFMHDALARHLQAREGDALLRAVNDTAIARGPFAMTTAVVLGFSAGSRELELAYAGHAPVLLRRAREGRVSPIDPPPPLLRAYGPTRNVALAVCEEVGFDPVRMVLERGDRLFLYTDGLSDARDRHGSAFGERRIRKALQIAGAWALPRLKRALVSAVRGHTGNGLGHDDVTFALVEVL